MSNNRSLFRFYNGFFYAFLCIVLFHLYFPLISADPITRYDDKMLLLGIEGIHSLKDYYYALLDGSVLDIQPVRDLSYLLDLKIKAYLSIYSFHLTNLLIWIFICLLFHKILLLFSTQTRDSKLFAGLLVVFLAISPVSASSVAWIAARKHLLSTLFILAATYIFLKKRAVGLNLKDSLLIILSYSLSCLSQPINVLWPFFVLAFSLENKESAKTNLNKKLFLILALLGAFFVGLNYYYYQIPFTEITGGDGKYSADLGLGLSLLALGRYFYLAIFPFSALPVSHFQGSWENLIGLYLLASFLIMLAFLFIRLQKKICLSFVLYFFLPLIPVTYKITRIFCSDTYLLNASIGLYLTFFLLLKDRFNKVWGALFLGYILFLGIHTLDYVGAFSNTFSIWNFAYNKEVTPMSVVNLAAVSIDQRDYRKAWFFLKKLEILEPDNRLLIKLKSDAISQDPSYLDVDKIKLLENLSPQKPIVSLKLALLYSNLSNPEAFKKNIINFFEKLDKHSDNFDVSNEKLIAIIRVTCEKNALEDLCKQKFKDLSQKYDFKKWDSKIYEGEYFKLKHQPEPIIYQ